MSLDLLTFVCVSAVIVLGVIAVWLASMRAIESVNRVKMRTKR